MSIIEVKELIKDFKVYQQQSGFVKVLKSFVKQDIKKVNAVKNVSFSINEGETVGFIGENGAGKSTTIKIMSGILYPTSGEVLVDGIRPYENRRRNAMNIGVIFGQRSRLLWDLPMKDSFELYKEIYKIDKEIFEENVKTFIELLDMGDYIKTPIRQLSLGQRMKVEISLAQLHDPKILFMDEPTIGLDVLAKSNIRQFILESNKKRGTTTLLTSHDMKDLDQVCERIIMISKGEIIYDGGIKEFKLRYGGQTLIRVVLANECVITHPKFLVSKVDKYLYNVIFDKNEISLPEVISYITSNCEVIDMSIKEPDIEDIVKEMYVNNSANNSK